MKIAIMQPYIFPYIGYFKLINCVDKFVIYDDVNYINRGWINRNNILVNAKRTLFTIPLKKASQNKLINEIEIISDLKWKKKFIKTIHMAYSRAPHFAEVFPVFEKIINNNEKNLSKYIYASLVNICTYININTEFISTSTIYQNNHLKGQYRILDICLKEKSNHYINPPGGKELYDRELFQKNNIKLNFIKAKDFSYSQLKNKFVSHLSIVDVMMFNSIEKLRHLLEEYELTE